ncbi:polysialyltransferase family glycosyltransferase [Leptolyngbya sp. AN03gr2]|uniref:polysialyltransferase family glycosyltransferase n=1 Tax=unclassified Leptolyngbya TaxID=2650499 RepID=UPI003D31E3F2
MKRIITCQGSIQLIAALSALFYRERSQSDENYLVIYELYAPDQQHHEFAKFIQQMAESVCNWTSIVYLTPEQLHSIGHQLDSTPPHRIYSTVHQWLGLDQTDEIYLCRNWQFTNQLLINAYPIANRICYGDGIGLYFSENSAVVRRPFTPPPTPDQWVDWTWWKARSLWHRIRERLKLKTKLYSMPFKVGYFVLPDIFGETPPMSIVKLDPAHLLTVFQQFTSFVNEAQVREIQTAISQSPVSILLTSNFSEGDRLSQDNEIQAYREFLTSHELLPNSVLVIKPHPRDDLNKIDRLKDNLSDLYQTIVLLTDPNLFFLPFEVFFLKAFQNCDVRVFAVSSACLSLKLLFNVPSFIGFGQELTTRYFDPDFITARLEHEETLHHAIEQL